MHAAKGEKEPFRRLLTDVCASILLLIVPVIVGLILYADDIMELVFGASYLPGALSLQLLAAALLFAVGNGIAVNCVNAPLGEERVSMMATICAAVSNVALNLFMIPL
jgi:O-antigen/teichoic acid export membrane protein